MADREVTESWKDKNYEMVLTDYYFQMVKRLRDASNFPILINLKMAYNDLKSLSYSVVYSPHHLTKFSNDIKPILDDIEKILYGNPDDGRVLKIMQKYGVFISHDRNKNATVHNAQVIISQLWEVLFIVKQWAYEEGFFVTKPYSRKYGTEAIDDAMEQ